MVGLPYLTLFLAAFIAFEVITGLREGVIHSWLLGGSHRDRHPVQFWSVTVFFTVGAAGLAGYAILNIANGT